MKHLLCGDQLFCDCEGDNGDLITEDPRDATCVDCLRRAASYGAAAAMRYAAVEETQFRDPELQQERDFAVAKLNEFRKALADVDMYVCEECCEPDGLPHAVLHVGTQHWCRDCVSKRAHT